MKTYIEQHQRQAKKRQGVFTGGEGFGVPKLLLSNFSFLSEFCHLQKKMFEKITNGTSREIFAKIKSSGETYAPRLCTAESAVTPMSGGCLVYIV